MRTLLALSVLAFAAGCSHRVDTAGAPSFGAAVQLMQTQQTVPGPVSDEPPEGSGATGADAQTRYQTGRTRPLLPSSTSSANPSTN